MGNLAIAEEPLPLRTDSGGVIRVGGTRVTLDSVVHAFKQGAAAEDIIRKFPTLALADVYVVIGYYLHHKTDVDTYLQEQERQAEEIRRQDEVRYNHRGLRDRLLARRQKGVAPNP